MSIRLRLTLWYTAVVAATMFAFGAALYVFLSATLHNDLQEKIRAQGQQLLKQMQPVFVPSRRGFRLDFRLSPTASFQTDIAIQVVDSDGNTTQKSSNLGSLELPLSGQTMDQARRGPSFYEKASLDGLPILIYNVPLIYDNTFYGILRVAVKTDAVENSLASLRNVMLATGLFTLIVAASVGMFLARKALKPIDNVIEAANRIEKSADLDRRIDYKGPRDEIGRLTETINGMLSRIQAMYNELDEAYRAQRRFVSDASHELRTPLTTIRGNVDLLEKMWKSAVSSAGDMNARNMEMSLEAMKDIAAEAERMTRLVNDMLSLARADAGYEMQKEPVELKPLVEEVVRRAHFLPRTVDWKPGDLDALDGVFVYGNKDYLQQLLFIFIENAFKYTDEGFVALDVMRLNGQVGIKISDTGIGMDKNEVPHIFDRFYRADPSRGKKAGTGLGLSIAKWIIDEHNGSIEVKTRKNEGTTFIVWLPEMTEIDSLSSPDGLGYNEKNSDTFQQ